jgi:hypothetical protein
MLSDLISSVIICDNWFYRSFVALMDNPYGEVVELPIQNFQRMETCHE